MSTDHAPLAAATEVAADPPRRGALRLRPWTVDDAPALGAFWARNRDHLSPTQPRRPTDFWAAEGQRRRILAGADDVAAGRMVPLLVLEIMNPEAGGGDPQLVGEVVLSGVVRGPFQSCTLGYSIDAARLRCGVATAAVGAAVLMGFERLGLHRVQAATLLDNVASQRVLARLGFERIGVAARYLEIAGVWRDHMLFQRVAAGDHHRRSPVASPDP